MAGIIYQIQQYRLYLAYFPTNDAGNGKNTDILPNCNGILHPYLRTSSPGYLLGIHLNTLSRSACKYDGVPLDLFVIERNRSDSSDDSFNEKQNMMAEQNRTAEGDDDVTEGGDDVTTGSDYVTEGGGDDAEGDTALKAAA